MLEAYSGVAHVLSEIIRRIKMTQYNYQRGLIFCSACDKFLSPIHQAEEIEVNPKSSQLYHKREFCSKTTFYASRLRLHSRGKVARTKRQKEATYY